MKENSAADAADAGVSVVIPTFNRRELLLRALASVYAQTLPPQQVIVVDDGSTDGTGLALQQAYPQVDYLWQPNRGVSSARNVGIGQADQPWIALLDSDDEWMPGKLERQFQRLRETPEVRVCHCEEIWIRNGRRVNSGKRHVKPEGDVFDDCLPLCAMSPSSILVHRSVWSAVGLFDEQLPACEDYDLWLRIAARYPVALVKEPQIKKYGGHTDQLSNAFWGMDRFRIRALQRLLQQTQLSAEQYQAALAVLTDKTEIYVAGVLKRGRHAEAQRLREVLRTLTDLAPVQPTPASEQSL
ncbi:MAG: glycosyltransferase family 2 protein [Gammaproteobacteria bacterium]|nr:MAG: glycosyltransferase family 2 protein [Gammaproteobacteria bacterium]RLA15697.1 MAG: glycosyltransferase family 2 protein [Gammaproteobacteria bacterium]